MSKPSDPTDQPKRKRATNAELNARTSKIISYIHLGVDDDRIKQILQEEGLKPWTARRAVDKAWAIIAALGSAPTEKERGILIKRLNEVFKQTQTGETKNLDHSIKVLGLYASILPKDKKGYFNGSGHSEVKAPASSSQLDEILARLGSANNATESKPG